jgi:peptidoglycan/LPS O-acetylase OafA/YrhL
MPAALLVAVVSLILSYFIFGSDRVPGLFLSFFSSAFWFSNIHYYLNVGYFDTVSQGNPFLHYWSLSVEEQFYIFWPILVVFILKRRMVAYAALTLFAVFLSFWMYSHDPQAMFFLTPARVFQFAAGAMVAVLHNHVGSSFFDQKWASYSALILGIAGIMVSAIASDGANYEFFRAALLPTAASALLLAFIHTPIFTRLL